MRYVLLTHCETPFEWDRSAIDSITRSGELIEHERLAHSSLGTTECCDTPDVTAPLAGYVVIECETADRARAIARALTPTPGAVEVRPLMRTAGLEM